MESTPPPEPLSKPVDVSAERLNQNWTAYFAELMRLIQSNAYLTENYERNLKTAAEFAKNLPLVHAVRGFTGSDFTAKMVGVKAKNAFVSRAEGEKGGAGLAQIIDGGDWDQLTGLYRFVSASVANVYSTLVFGENLFVIDPNVLTREESFFVPAPDTVLYRDDRENLNDAVLPADKLQEWLGIFTAGFYDDPANYLTEELFSMRTRLHGQGIPYEQLAFLSYQNHGVFTPEVRIKRIPTADIIGFTVASGTETTYAKGSIAAVKDNFPKCSLIGNSDPKYIGVGKVIADWYAANKPPQ